MEPERIIDGINIPAASDNLLGLLKKATKNRKWCAEACMQSRLHLPMSLQASGLNGYHCAFLEMDLPELIPTPRLFSSHL
jgi:hypothetical protein